MHGRWRLHRTTAPMHSYSESFFADAGLRRCIRFRRDFRCGRMHMRMHMRSSTRPSPCVASRAEAQDLIRRGADAGRVRDRQFTPVGERA